MASFSSKFAVLSFVSIFANSWMAIVADPDKIYDFLVPANISADQLNENPFTFNGIRRFPSSDTPRFNVNHAMKYQIGDYVAISILNLPAGFVNPPSTSPDSAELLFLLEGTLEVGFIDTSNKLYTRTLQVGDLFLFPKGLVHFHYNPNNNSEARAIAVYGGFAGTVFLPSTLFSSGVDDGILAQSFKTDVATIQKLTAGLGSHSRV